MLRILISVTALHSFNLPPGLKFLRIYHLDRREKILKGTKSYVTLQGWVFYIIYL